MNLSKFLLASLVFLCLITTDAFGAINPEEPEAYRFMIFRASPYGELRGRHPVSIEEIGYGQHFRFYRDEEGRVERIEYWSRKQLRKGGYERFGAIGGSASLHFVYEKNKVIRSYHNEKGEPELNSWGIAVEEIELDKNGHKKSMIYKDLEGNRIEDSRGVWEMIWDVSKDGKTVVEKRVGKDGKSRRFNNFLDFGDVKMIFDDNGLRWETWNLDDNGEVANSPQRQVAGVKTTWDVYHLDEKNILWVDKEGNPKDLEPFDEVMPGTYGFCTETYEHDMFGNTTGLFMQKVNGKLFAPQSNGGLFARQIYDKYGFLIDYRFFNDTGVPTENAQGIARVELIRNETRLVTQVRRYNIQGEIANGTNDGIAIINYSYSETDELVGQEFLDKDGNKVNPGN